MSPLYIAFPSTDAINAWTALLRSYSVPEVYGRRIAPADQGGLYRMWRQVDLTCLQGRNLGVARPLSDEAPTAEQEARAEADAIDMDVYCEILVNGILCGRTTVKKGIGSPDWHEKFAFTDLPPFANLEVLVYREKKMQKAVLMGSTVIPLMNFRRGEYVEGWFPVLGGQGYVGAVMGEVRLKLKVDEYVWDVTCCCREAERFVRQGDHTSVRVVRGYARGTLIFCALDMCSYI